MLILSVMGVLSRHTCMFSQFFSKLVGMGFRSHDFDNEPKIRIQVRHLEGGSSGSHDSPL